jgi:3-oxoacyl-[acyl-carrier protein] reductase
MDLDLKGKVALVTGSSKGIGKNIAYSLIEEGCSVTFNGRNESNLKLAVKKIDNTNYVVADVTNPIECKKLINNVIKKFGKIDILICNVGNGNSVLSESKTSEEWKKMFDINFFSAINIIDAAKKSLQKTKGTIVCISSIAGVETTGAPITYSVSKTALISYVKRISKSFAKKGIRINSVSPGNIFFKGSTWENKLKKNKKEVNKMLENNVALKRFGTPQEVSNLVTFLVSSRSSFITGSNFVIDGGQLNS